MFSFKNNLSQARKHEISHLTLINISVWWTNKCPGKRRSEWIALIFRSRLKVQSVKPYYSPRATAKRLLDNKKRINMRRKFEEQCGFDWLGQKLPEKYAAQRTSIGSSCLSYAKRLILCLNVSFVTWKYFTFLNSFLELSFLFIKFFEDDEVTVEKCEIKWR